MANEGAAGGFINAAPANNDKLPVVRGIFDFSAEALGELKTWLEQNPPAVTIQSIVGFTQFTAVVADTVTAGETTTSTSYTDLTTVGPKLTGLSDGQYLFIYGSFVAANKTAGNTARMSIASELIAADDAWAGQSSTQVGSSIVAFKAMTLKNGSNTVTAKYRVNGGTGTFNLRALFALRYANV